MPALTVEETRIYDGFNNLSGQSLGTFLPDQGGNVRSNESGNYSAGQASISGLPPYQEDQANTKVPLSSFVGGDTARAAVLLPYTLSTGAVRLNISALHTVPTGSTVTMRGWQVWPTIGGAAPRGTWYLDGVQVGTTTPTMIFPGATSQVWEYSRPNPMNVRGTHTWQLKVGTTTRTLTMTVR